MKYNKKIPTILKPRIGLLLMLIAGILQAGCSDKLADITPGQTEISTVSSYDGQPIIEMDDLSFLEGSYFEHWRNRLAGNYGSELVRAVNSQTIKAKGVAKDFGSPIMLNKIVAGSKAKSEGVMSTHLRLSEPDGETEEFMLSVRRYIHN